LSVADIAALGVRSISVGGAWALAAWTGFRRAAQMLKSEGSFAGLESLVPVRRHQRVLYERLPRARLTDCDRRDQHEYNERSSE
jgi:2-methylisocitrate lyase-like PEP mutase family enzyme